MARRTKTPNNPAGPILFPALTRVNRCADNLEQLKKLPGGSAGWLVAGGHLLGAIWPCTIVSSCETPAVHPKETPMSAGGASAAAAAAAAQRRRREEEETMSGYTHADLIEGWEFKILRSATSQFRKPEGLRQALEEEARAGWVLVEKFDNQRLRLKRPASARAGDAALGFDPYRTSYGMSEAKLTFMILGIVFGCVGLLLGLIALMATRG